MTPAVAYLRVSTQEQAAHGQGLEVQRDQIIEWAEREGRVIVGWYVDAGKSGSNGLEARQALGDALEALRTDDGKPLELVVPDLSRLSRDLVLQELLLGEVRTAGARLRCVDPEEDRLCEEGGEDDDPGRTLIRQVFGAIKQFDKAMIRLRLMRGRKHKMDRGGYGGGGVGYGTRLEDDQIVPDEATWPVLERIAALHDAGVSYAKIAEELNADGLRGPDGEHDWYARAVGRAHGRWQRVIATR